MTVMTRTEHLYDDIENAMTWTEESALTLHVTADGSTWRTYVFHGGSDQEVDAAAAAWLAGRTHSDVVLDEDHTCWSSYPKTFAAVYEAVQGEPAALMINPEAW